LAGIRLKTGLKTMKFDDILQPYDKLVEIEILGKRRMVPENNSLLRCFQFLSVGTISYGNFCWNGSCDNCIVRVESGTRKRNLMSCRTRVKEGMKIVHLNHEIDLDIR
jgi:NADH dehydrogenase/NADH:ubiquinone oxidoreductase subunit G